MAHAERSVVQRGVEVLAEHQRPNNAGMTEEERKWMFGDEQYMAHQTS